MNYFAHSGDAGDVIYGLPVVRALGGGVLVLTSGRGTRVRDPMNPRKVASLATLLGRQPYVKGVVYDADGRTPVTHDMDRFRRPPYRRLQLPDPAPVAHSPTRWPRTGRPRPARPPKPSARERRLLPDWQLAAWGLPTFHRDAPWLTDVEPDPDVPPVLFAKTFRWANPAFPWEEVFRRYGRAAAFVGAEDEWRAFCAALGPVPHYPTPDHLSLARAIAGTRLFVANQSMPFAVCMGLGTTQAVLEACPTADDCRFSRPNVTLGDGPAVDLPEMDLPGPPPAPEPPAAPPAAPAPVQAREEQPCPSTSSPP